MGSRGRGVVSNSSFYCVLLSALYMFKPSCSNLGVRDAMPLGPASDGGLLTFGHFSRSFKEQLLQQCSWKVLPSRFPDS